MNILGESAPKPSKLSMFCLPTKNDQHFHENFCQYLKANFLRKPKNAIKIFRRPSGS